MRTTLIFALLILCACDGTEEAAAAPGTDGDADTDTNGVVSAADGGTVVSDDGLLTLHVLPGALDEDTAITVTRTEDVFAYALQPDGLTFSTPAEWTLSWDPDLAIDVTDDEGESLLTVGTLPIPIVLLESADDVEPLPELMFEKPAGEAGFLMAGAVEHFSTLHLFPLQSTTEEKGLPAKIVSWSSPLMVGEDGEIHAEVGDTFSTSLDISIEETLDFYYTGGGGFPAATLQSATTEITSLLVEGPVVELLTGPSTPWEGATSSHQLDFRCEAPGEATLTIALEEELYYTTVDARPLALSSTETITLKVICVEGEDVEPPGDPAISFLFNPGPDMKSGGGFSGIPDVGTPAVERAGLYRTDDDRVFGVVWGEEGWYESACFVSRAIVVDYSAFQDSGVEPIADACPPYPHFGSELSSPITPLCSSGPFVFDTGYVIDGSEGVVIEDAPEFVVDVVSFLASQRLDADTWSQMNASVSGITAAGLGEPVSEASLRAFCE